MSLDDRFQERAECWVDARTGVAIADDVRRRLQRAPSGPDTVRQAVSVIGAIAAAHRLLDQLAAERRAELTRQVGPVREAELGRTRAYYDEVLAGLARRRASTPPERHPLLDARAEATIAERARRLAEIEDKHRGYHVIRPFRLHLLAVPALTLPVDVRRGARRYPVTLDWLLPAGRFADLRCPSCAGTAPWVAGKDRLGCRTCLPRAAVVAAPPDPRPVPAIPRRVEGAPEAAPVDSAPAPGRSRRRAPGAAAPQDRRPAAAALAAGREGDPEQPRRTVAVTRAAEKAGLAFWQNVAAGDRRVGRAIAPGSPAEALHRLLGADGPAVVVGVPAATRLLSVTGGAGADDREWRGSSRQDRSKPTGRCTPTACAGVRCRGGR